MYRLTNVVVFIAIALLAESQVRADGEVPQIKVTRIEVPYNNPKYSNQLKFTIVKHNATYNTMHVDWELIHDLPNDIVLTVDVYVTNSKYQDERLVLQESIPLCRESPKRQLLVQNALVLPKSRLQQCIRKGIHSNDNSGVFRIDLAIPNIHEISDYHYARYRIKTDSELIAEAIFVSEWGYLNTN